MLCTSATTVALVTSSPRRTSRGACDWTARLLQRAQCAARPLHGLGCCLDLFFPHRFFLFFHRWLSFELWALGLVGLRRSQASARTRRST